MLKCYMDDNFNHSDIAYDVPLQNSTFNDSNVKVSKAAEFGTLTGIVIALVINFIISLEVSAVYSKYNYILRYNL